MQPLAPEYGVDIVGATTLERVRYGAFLHHRTGKPVLVSGGQVQMRTTPIGIQMYETLTKEFNVPVRWTESRSMTTHENAAYSSELLKRDGVSRVLLVTHAWHMRRAMAAFRAEGLEPIAAPTRFIRPPLPLARRFRAERVVAAGKLLRDPRMARPAVVLHGRPHQGILLMARSFAHE